MATVLKRSKTVVERDGAGSAWSCNQETIRDKSDTVGGRMSWGNPYFGGCTTIEVNPEEIAAQGVAVYRRPRYADIGDLTSGKICGDWITSGNYDIDILPAKSKEWECFSTYKGLTDRDKQVIANRLVSSDMKLTGEGHYVFIRPSSMLHVSVESDGSETKADGTDLYPDNIRNPSKEDIANNGGCWGILRRAGTFYDKLPIFHLLVTWSVESGSIPKFSPPYLEVEDIGIVDRDGNIVNMSECTVASPGDSVVEILDYGCWTSGRRYFSKASYTHTKYENGKFVIYRGTITEEAMYKRIGESSFMYTIENPWPNASESCEYAMLVSNDTTVSEVDGVPIRGTGRLYALSQVSDFSCSHRDFDGHELGVGIMTDGSVDDNIDEGFISYYDPKNSGGFYCRLVSCQCGIYDAIGNKTGSFYDEMALDINDPVENKKYDRLGVYTDSVGNIILVNTGSFGKPPREMQSSSITVNKNWNDLKQVGRFGVYICSPDASDIEPGFLMHSICDCTRKYYFDANTCDFMARYIGWTEHSCGFEYGTVECSTYSKELRIHIYTGSTGIQPDDYYKYNRVPLSGYGGAPSVLIKKNQNTDGDSITTQATDGNDVVINIDLDALFKDVGGPQMAGETKTIKVNVTYPNSIETCVDDETGYCSTKIRVDPERSLDDISKWIPFSFCQAAKL